MAFRSEFFHQKQPIIIIERLVLYIANIPNGTRCFFVVANFMLNWNDRVRRGQVYR